jgi:hypothetical protein
MADRTAYVVSSRNFLLDDDVLALIAASGEEAKSSVKGAGEKVKDAFIKSRLSQFRRAQ